MRRGLVIVALLVPYTALALGLGWVVGGLLWAAPAARRSAGAADGGRAAHVETQRREQPLICTDPEALQTEAGGSGELDLAIRWCEARLEEALRERPTSRRPWPPELDDEEHIEAPDQWVPLAQRVFRSCPEDFELVTTDCAEYPCVAALRPRMNDFPTSFDGEEDLMPLIAACSGYSELQGRFDELHAVPVSVRCPDGSTEWALLFAAFDSDNLSHIAPDAFPEPDGGGIYWGLEVLIEALIHFGRRAESVTQLWTCGEGGSR